MILLIIFILFSGISSAVVSSNTHWEVRTTGSNSNGGGFVSGATGTDRSQSDAAFCTAADFAVTVTAATSTLCPFSAASVGNIIQITAGSCTAGFYEVVSVASVTATLDRTAGTATGCTAALGGGLLTVAKPLPSVTGSNSIWIRSGTYSVTASIVWSISASTHLGPIRVEGYSSTHGDLGTKPLITTATNSIDLFSIQGNGVLFRNISFSNTASTRANGFITQSTISNVFFDRCLFDGFTRHIFADNVTVWGINNLIITRSEFKNATTAGIVSSFQSALYGNYIHNNAGAGYTQAQAICNNCALIFSHNIFYANGYGYDETVNEGGTQSVMFSNNVFADNTNDGIRFMTGTTLYGWILNNVFYANGAYGVDNRTSASNLNAQLTSAGNAYGANGTAASLNWVANDITLSADPFTARTSGDFSLNNTSGGGASLRGTAFPGAIPNAGTGYLDVGALQSLSSTTPGVSVVRGQSILR